MKYRVLHEFHDGLFDGIRLESDKTATLFLRSGVKRSYTMILKGVEALVLNDLRPGNIILDLTVRNSREATLEDVLSLYQTDRNSEHAAKLLDNLREKHLYILELNPSYGAEGLFLFESFDIIEISQLSGLPVVQRQ